VPKTLTEAQVQSFQRDGFLSPVRAMSAERARHYRERFESLEARVADIKKMKTKSHLLCPWVLEIAEDPFILDIFEDLIGPNLRCWSMAWRVKKADGETFAGWHQDSFYGSAVPVVLGALALSECGSRQGCLRGIPGSHKWGVLRHEETDDPRSILARGQYITEPFDESKAVDFELRPGEMAMFDNSLVHGSAGNFGPDRRFLLLVEMLPTWGEARARPPAGDAHARRRHVRQLRRRAQAGRRVLGSRTRQLGTGGRGAREAPLRGQPLRPERGLRGHAAGYIGPDSGRPRMALASAPPSGAGPRLP
jgi:non-haem Fe2+, alpha-ketoglutarate-dependent halogenase